MFAGEPGKPYWLPLCLVLASCLLVCAVMTTTYCANLNAFLSVEKYEVPFETFLDLSEQKACRIGVLGQSSVEERIKVLVSLTSVK